jgi:hypothetical protein
MRTFSLLFSVIFSSCVSEAVIEPEYCEQPLPSITLRKEAPTTKTPSVPLILLETKDEPLHTQFRKQADVAQYKGSDYSNAIRVERGISVEKAFSIAASDPAIDYFVYVKGGMMVLEVPPGVDVKSQKDPLGLITYNEFVYDSGDPGEGATRIFENGDVVFFQEEGMWLGTAPGLADTYHKIAD